MRRIRLDDYIRARFILNLYTYISVRPLGFTRISPRNHIPKMLCIFMTGVRTHLTTCMAAPLEQCNFLIFFMIRVVMQQGF